MVSIRKARLADVGVLASMEERYALDQKQLVLRENPRLRPYMQRRRGKLGEIKKWLRKCIRSTRCLVFLAEADGRPIGFCVASIQTSPPIRRLRRYGSIDLLYVQESWRARGISSLMMKTILAWFRRRQVKHLSLQVIRDNRLARSIYAKWGFYDFFVEMRRKL
ncbi:MAG TPA: GNAT family N-acetyltransferase [Terriglobales bacterium]